MLVWLTLVLKSGNIKLLRTFLEAKAAATPVANTLRSSLSSPLILVTCLGGKSSNRMKHKHDYNLIEGLTQLSLPVFQG